MSRMATNGYIGAKRRAYANARPGKRRRILDEVYETTGHSRKCANRLLTGSRKFKERKGRGPTYTEQDKAVLVRIWRGVGCPCTTYFRANVDEWRCERWKMPFSRSRPYRKNDNAHVEQKNGSVVRTLLGESRLDRRALEPELRRLCEGYSDYRNFCVPCKMLVAKTKRKDGKGFTCRYDKPQTPYARALVYPAVPQDAKNALGHRKKNINGIVLYHRILKTLRRIRRLQAAPVDYSPVPVHSALAPDGAPLRGRPSLPGTGRNDATSHQLNPSRKCPAFDERNVQTINQRVSVLFDELGGETVERLGGDGRELWG